jgi:uncharacterized membrane protein YozB (DUF420 family)
MKALLTKPGFLGTHGNLGADSSVVMAVVFTALFLIGWQMAKRHDGNRHHGLVLGAMVGMLIYFTLYYLARQLGAIAVAGKEGFGGPSWVYDFVFTPLINIHIVVVSVGLVMAVYMIILGFRTAVRKNGRRVLRAGRLSMSMRALYKILVWAFIAFAGLGLIREWMRGYSLGLMLVYVSGFLLVAVVLLAEKGIERLIPDGERRHRAIGTFTMTLFVIALITSTSTYVLLYVLYPPKISPM